MPQPPAPPRATDHRWSVHHPRLRPGVGFARAQGGCLAAERTAAYDAGPGLDDGPLLGLVAERTAVYDAGAGLDDGSLLGLVAERTAAYDEAPGPGRHVADPPAAVVVGGDAMLQDVRVTLAGLGEHLRDLIAQIPRDGEAGDVGVETLDACFAELKRFEGASAALKARLIAFASAAKAHRQAGVADTGAYLRDRLGVSGREAKRQAELSKTLDAMAGAADAVADGRLGIEQAGILGRAARNGHLGGSGEVERDLLEAATSSNPEDLQRTVRKREQRADADALRRDENRAYALRRASMSKDPGGMWTLRAELDPVNGELVSRAIRAFMRPDPKDTPPGQRRSTEKRTADGLIDLVEAALNGGSAPTSGGVRPHVSVVVMADQPGAHDGCHDGRHDRRDVGDGRRDGGHGDGDVVGVGGSGGCCGVHSSRDARGRPVPPHGVGVSGSGTVFSPEATARLVCDSALSRIVMAGPSQVLDVGRAARNWSDPQRRAIVARDGACRGPGCDRPADWCDIHHIWWWRNGGPTDLANGILLCRHHHRMVHEGGWQLRLEPTTARAVFTDPRGKDVATLPRGAPTLLA